MKVVHNGHDSSKPETTINEVIAEGTPEPAPTPPVTWVKPILSYTKLMSILKMRAGLRKVNQIYFSSDGIWWTHDKADLITDSLLMKMPPDKRELYQNAVKRGEKIVTDPEGHTLNGTTDWIAWMKQPIDYPDHHDIATFMAGHAQNHRIFNDGAYPKVFKGWSEFKALMEQQLTAEDIIKFT